MKRIILTLSVVAMVMVLGFVQRTPSAAMANCSKTVVDQGWINATNSLVWINQMNVYAGETVSLYLQNSNPAKNVYFNINGQTMTQLGSGTMSVTFNQALNNIWVKGGGDTLVQPNHYWMVWYEIDALTPCKPITKMK